MPVSRFKHRLHSVLPAIRLGFFILSGLAALGGLFYFLATTGPKRISGNTVVVSTPDDPAAERLSAEIEALEKQYRQAAEANLITTGATEALTQAIEKQKELLRTFSKAGVDQSTRLVRLESELDSIRAREKVMLVERMEKDGEESLTAGNLRQAGDRLREALRLQREINQSSASSRYKNYVRETALMQSVNAVEAAPIRKEVDTAVAAARKAVEESRWPEALAAYTAARDAQDRINREYGRTRYADLAGSDRLSAEIESLNAAGTASEIIRKEREGDEAIARGRPADAAALFGEAENLQTQVNKNFPRSRFVSSQKIEDLQVKTQTALSSNVADSLAQLDRAISGHLKKRQVVAAEQKLEEAGQLVEKLFKDFPKSRRLDGGLRIKFAYLTLRRSNLRQLQDEVYDRLLPLPGVSERLLMRTEVPQSLYVLVMNTNPSRNPGRLLPVDSVNWSDAQEFCTRLSWLLGTPARLPSSDELRVALGGDGVVDTWNSANSEGKSRETGRGTPNASGFSDLVGNLAEWTNAEISGDRAVVFGGSYLDTPEALAKVPSETRLRSDRARHVGLRIIVEL